MHLTLQWEVPWNLSGPFLSVPRSPPYSKNDNADDLNLLIHKRNAFCMGTTCKMSIKQKLLVFFLNVHQLETSLKLILFQSLNLSMDFEIENLLHTLTHHFQWQWHWVKHSYCSSLNWRENFTAAACTSLSLWCTEKFERSLLDQNPLCLLRQLLRYATKAQQTDRIRDEEATLQDDCRQVSEGSRGKNSFPKT